MRLSAKQQGRLDGFFTVQPKDPKDVKKRKVRRLVLVFLDLPCRKLTKTLSPWAFRWTTRRIRKARSQRLVLARRSERERGGRARGWMDVCLGAFFPSPHLLFVDHRGGDASFSDSVLRVILINICDFHFTRCCPWSDTSDWSSLLLRFGANLPIESIRLLQDRARRSWH